MEAAQKISDGSDRYKPEELEINDPSQQQIFHKAHNRFEIHKATLKSAESKHSSAKSSFMEATTKLWRDNTAAKRNFIDAINKYEQIQMDLAEARRGFTIASSEFSQLSDYGMMLLFILYLSSLGDYYKRQADLYLAKTQLDILRIKKEQLTTQMAMVLQLKYIDTINADRLRFANKWKTFFEKAGGPGGISGYLTILSHYSAVVYLHLFLISFSFLFCC